MQGEFAQMVRDLPRTYNLKAIADYLTGPGSQVTVEQAQEAIATAVRFVDVIVAVLEAELDRSP